MSEHAGKARQHAQNEPAIRLYEKLGFERVRNLEVWTLESVPGDGGGVQRVPLGQAQERIRQERPEREPWQRADETVANLDEVEGLEERISKTIPLYLRYVCLSWPQHLQEASFTIILCDKLSLFVNRYLLYWFEVLSLTKDFDRIPGRALRNVIAWIPVNISTLSPRHSLTVCSPTTQICPPW